MRRQSSQPWRKSEVIRREFAVSFRRTEMGHFLEMAHFLEIRVSLSNLSSFFRPYKRHIPEVWHQTWYRGHSAKSQSTS